MVGVVVDVKSGVGVVVGVGVTVGVNVIVGVGCVYVTSRYGRYPEVLDSCWYTYIYSPAGGLVLAPSRLDSKQ
jgi:hypothetical protein